MTKQTVSEAFASIDQATSDRSQLFNGLFFDLKSGWVLPFWLMLTLASGIASLGLSEDSAATIIGAMIVAPLGQPIVALGAAIAMRWPLQTARMLALVAVGAASVVAIGYFAGLILPSGNPNDQILARTAPDFRDLGIAILSGAAGAFGYRRSEYSSVLAGVAIAVALVPPLCVAGMMLEDGRMILSFNAVLLFLTNFAGISLAAVFVFAVAATTESGASRSWFIGLSALVLAVNAGVLVPLSLNYDRVIGTAAIQADAYSAIREELRGSFARSVIKSVHISGSELAVELSPMPSDPGAQKSFSDALQRATGFQIVLSDGAEP